MRDCCRPSSADSPEPPPGEAGTSVLSLPVSGSLLQCSKSTPETPEMDDMRKRELAFSPVSSPTPGAQLTACTCTILLMGRDLARVPYDLRSEGKGARGMGMSIYVYCIIPGAASVPLREEVLAGVDTCLGSPGGLCAENSKKIIIFLEKQL